MMDPYFANGGGGESEEGALPYLHAGRENPQPGSGPTITSVLGSGPALRSGPGLSPGPVLEPGSDSGFVWLGSF